ncbi:RsfA family transcriptional regulator [Geobacillus sp. YF-1]|uniref:RsfA family transcriptional regulator n=1 Tax=Geobacillus sp. YF-1 TaxID=3457480 RepID=UPI0040467292
MTGIRQDAWTKEEDELLASVVLQYIREGNTQLEAFAEVGRRLSRTAAACGFRWNSCVRKQYKEDIELAKQERKRRKKEVAAIKESGGRAKVEAEGKQHLSWPDVLAFLQAEEQKAREARRAADENRALKNDMEQLQQMVTKLQMEKEALEKQLAAVQEEYKTLLAIMERARQMVADHEKPEPNEADGAGES